MIPCIFFFSPNLNPKIHPNNVFWRSYLLFLNPSFYLKISQASIPAGIPGFPSPHLPLSMATPYLHHRALADAIAQTCHLGGWKHHADVHLQTHTIHGTGIYTYIWLNFYGECRQIYHTWMIWEMWRTTHGFSGWWLNQPLWKNISQNGNLPQIGVTIKKCLKPPPSFWIISLHRWHVLPPKLVGKFGVDLLIYMYIYHIITFLLILWGTSNWWYIFRFSWFFDHRFAACWISPPNSGIPDLAVFAGVMFEMGAFSPTMGTTT